MSSMKLPTTIYMKYFLLESTEEAPTYYIYLDPCLLRTTQMM
jgi:hypothetical protein